MTTNYLWNPTEAFTYGWPDWTRWFWGVPPRWQPPICDVPERPLNTRAVVASEPREWPVELRHLDLGIMVPGTVPYEGSVPHGGIPVQRVTRAKMTTFTVTNPYGGMDLATGDTIRGRYRLDLPTPTSGQYGHEGYPNPDIWKDVDRHWIGVEDDGTVWETIWMAANAPAGPEVMNVAAWNPDGSPKHVLAPGGAVFKGQAFHEDFRWSAHALNRYDPPHRLGVWLYDLGGGDGDQAWAFPRYGQILRLSTAVYERLYPTANAEQRIVLDSLHTYGATIYDRGGDAKRGWHCSLGMVAGRQWVGSTLANFRIPLAALELVTA